MKNYAVDRPIVNGDNRYLSGDLLDLLVGLLDFGQVRTKRERTFCASAFTNVHHFPNGAFYAPGAAYPRADAAWIIRFPRRFLDGYPINHILCEKALLAW